MGRRKRHLAILVLGDLGRSPRMLYHSLAATADDTRQGGKDGEEFAVSLIGVAGSKLPHQILENENIHVHLLFPPPPLLFKSKPPRLLYPLVAAIKLLWQTIQLLFVLLFRIRRPDVLLIQTPPALPTLPLCHFVAWLRGAALVIDWHNLGYSLMEFSLRKGHPVVAFASMLERRFGRRATAHFCVTQAMKSFLENQWNVQPPPVVLPDMPAELFQKLEFTKRDDYDDGQGEEEKEHIRSSRKKPAEGTAMSQRDEVLGTLLRRYGEEWEEAWPGTMQAVQQVQKGACDRGSTRPTLLVMTGTSWTPDEDIKVLINALQRYDAEAADRGDSALPKLVVFITGKGPLKARYEASIRGLEWHYVQICTTFLAIADYALLVAASDFVISLHISSSGVDLPMKVLDAFGGGRPVLAADYNCIGELVNDGETGLVFQPHEGALCDGLVRMATDTALREALARRIEERFSESFEETWGRVAGPVLQSAMELRAWR